MRRHRGAGQRAGIVGPLKKYLQLGYGYGREPVTFARYIGQESNEERERTARNPPDILPTNYVILELIMTRFLETDKAVRNHAAGLRFLVLDELHTYRGGGRADVAMLFRRVRERINECLLCIGTSAAMALEGSAEARNAAVAGIESRLFRAAVDPGDVVSETLRRVTDREADADRADLVRHRARRSGDRSATMRSPSACSTTFAWSRLTTPPTLTPRASRPQHTLKALRECSATGSNHWDTPP